MGKVDDRSVHSLGRSWGLKVDPENMSRLGIFGSAVTIRVMNGVDEHRVVVSVVLRPNHGVIWWQQHCLLGASRVEVIQPSEVVTIDQRVGVRVFIVS